MARTYQLTEGELAIIRKAQETGDPNYFTSYFIKGETSGTWWRPGAQSDRWKLGYESLFYRWTKLGRPPVFKYGHEGREVTYNVVFDDDPDMPSFHNHHGFIFQPNQKELHFRSQRIGIKIAGFGCGKTIGGMAAMAYWAATLPGFQAVILAPNSTMTTSIYNDTVMLLEGTKYGENFVTHTAESPYPKIIIGNSLVGSNNRLLFYPVGDPRGTKKILTMNLDAALIDQTEQLTGLDEIIRNVGSRMRGQFKGRPRLGRITFLANSDMNDEMWDLYDSAEEDPKRIKAMTAKTSDNPFITDEQLQEIMKDVGGDEESIRVHMEGGRPVGGGEHFSAEMLNKIKSPLLDEVMNKALFDKEEGVIYEKMPKLGVYEWALPPKEGRRYLVVADPGYDNPPRRNSAVILVFDYTDFPSEPATLHGFFWVFGNNDPWPWIAKYTWAVETYKAQMANAIDATGMQSLYERLLPVLQSVNVTPMSLSGNNKYGYLNITKTMVSRGLFKLPSIPRFFMQLSRYTLPDTKLAQDIVMAFVLAGGWLERLFYMKQCDEEPKRREDFNPYDRHYREGDSRDERGGNRYERLPGRL